MLRATLRIARPTKVTSAARGSFERRPRGLTAAFSLFAASALWLLALLIAGCAKDSTEDNVGVTRAAFTSAPQITASRSLSATSVRPGDSISVTLTVDVGAIGTSPLRGLYVSDYLPAGYAVTSSAATLNGAAASVVRETEAVGSVYADATTERWVIETPTAWSQNHPVSQASTYAITYTMKVPASAAAGTVALRGFSWVGMIAALGASGDHFGYEDSPPSLTILANVAPTVATAASANPSSVTAKTTALSALGADDQAEAALTYTWATTGTPPAAVSFSANGTNAAKNTTATFSRAGSYSLHVTIRDGGGLTATSSVAVTVIQTATAIAISPASASVAINGSQPFAATLNDQFGVAMTSQPTFGWQVTGGGTVNAAALFTAGGSVGGPYTLTATSGSFTGTASVTVTLLESQLTIASSTSGAAQTPSTLAHDGNATTRFTNDGALSSAWITFNLSQTSTISRLSLLMYSGATRTYPIRVSVGSTVVFDGSSALVATAWSLPVTPTSGDSVTIRMTGASSAGSNWLSIFEVQVYGAGGAPPAATCNDSIKNQDETDVDCGGSTCAKCANDKACLVANDCASALCAASVCSAPPGGTVELVIMSATAGGAVQTPASYAIDGNTTTRYTNDNTLATASITFGLAAPARISTVRLMMYNGASRTYPLRIAVGTTVVFTESTTPTSGYWELPITPTTGSAVTITMTGANSSGSNWLSIFEAKLLGTP